MSLCMQNMYMGILKKSITYPYSPPNGPLCPYDNCTPLTPPIQLLLLLQSNSSSLIAAPSWYQIFWNFSNPFNGQKIN